MVSGIGLTQNSGVSSLKSWTGPRKGPDGGELSEELRICPQADHFPETRIYLTAPTTGSYTTAALHGFAEWQMNLRV